MEIFVEKDYAAMSRRGASIIAEHINSKPKTVLGLASGSSPLGMYQVLEEMCRRGDVSFKGVVGFNLDEYVGVSKDNHNSFYHFVKTNLVDRTDFKSSCLNAVDAMEKDINKACSDYENKISAAGGIELQILGIGESGHIGFNEPSDCFSLKTNCVELDEMTIKANSRFFNNENEVPRRALTMGIGTIMRAKQLLLLASGEQKAEIIYKAVFGKIYPGVPASILQLHNNVKLVLDEAAYSVIRKKNRAEG